MASFNNVYALSNGDGSGVAGNQSLPIGESRRGARDDAIGQPADTLTLPGAAEEVEGITMNTNGTIYNVSDNGNSGTNPSPLVYAPAPEPPRRR